MGKFWSGIGEALFGTESKKQGKELAAKASTAATEQSKTAATNAAAAGATAQQYGQGVQQSMGANAQDYLQKAQASAQQLAGQQAQAAATGTTQAVTKAARTAGANPAAAAIMAGKQAANTYGQTYQQGVNTGMDRYGQATGQFAGMQGQMANQQLGQQGIQQGAVGQQAGIGAQQTATGTQQAATTWGTIGNIAGALAMSDEKTKKNVEVTDPYELIKGNLNKYKQTSNKVIGMEKILADALENPTDGNLQRVEDAGLYEEYMKRMGLEPDYEAPMYGVEENTQDYRISRPEYPDDDRPARIEYPVGSPLEQVRRQVKPVSFDYKTDANGTKHLGVMAQDLEKTPLKNAVETLPNGLKAINTTELAPGLLNLIIELSNRVKSLEGGE